MDLYPNGFRITIQRDAMPTISNRVLRYLLGVRCTYNEDKDGFQNQKKLFLAHK